MKLDLANKGIFQLLELAAAEKEDIEVQGYQRGIGKTTALVEFARENDFFVIVGSNFVAKSIINYHKYDKVKSIDSKLDGIGPFVYDECCDRGKINELRIRGLQIKTGFVKL